MTSTPETETPAWKALAEELDAWQAAGRRASLWWRDDDAVEPTEALERLLDLAGGLGLPIALAVIPARASPRLAARLCQSLGVTVLQHGIAHRNLAGPGEKKQELGRGLPAAALLEALARGGARLRALFPSGGPGGGPVTRLPVLVPPWNRIDPDLAKGLAPLGFRGLSTMGPRSSEREHGLTRVNSHVDILRWSAPRGFLGEAEVLDSLTARLRARRGGAEDPKEATGLLTHHLAHEEPAWDFLARLLPRLKAHPAVAFPEPAALFAGEEAGA